MRYISTLILFIGLLFNSSIASNFLPGFLGVYVKDYNKDAVVGARVVNIFDESAAKSTSLKENDIIVAINNETVSSSKTLTEILKTYSWGDKVLVKYFRDGLFYETNTHLGYRKNTKSYNIKRISSNEFEEVWLFEDDNTMVTIKKNNEPIAISKQSNQCVVDKWFVGTNYHEEELPQCFLDLDDKVYAITKIKIDQEKRGVKINDILFIKTLLEKDTIPQAEVKEVNDLTLQTFAVYPNPSNGIFTIKVENKDFTPFSINIFDITGKVMNQEYVGTFNGLYTKVYDLSSIAKGSYLVQVIQNGKRITKKIIIQ